MTRIVRSGRGFTRINYGLRIITAGAGFYAPWMPIQEMRRYSDGRVSFPSNRKLSSRLSMSYLRPSRFRPARSLPRSVVFYWIPPNNASRTYNPKQAPALISCCGSGELSMLYAMLPWHVKQT